LNKLAIFNAAFCLNQQNLVVFEHTAPMSL
jgi:hypothetical protein